MSLPLSSSSLRGISCSLAFDTDSLELDNNVTFLDSTTLCSSVSFSFSRFDILSRRCRERMRAMRFLLENTILEEVNKQKLEETIEKERKKNSVTRDRENADESLRKDKRFK